jgi:LacI family gluconate utilization system Gnt-I transcriptional repressor
MKRVSKRKKSARPRAVDPEAPMPTMTDVARVTGFSQMTVSRAFLRAASIRTETKEAILKAASEIGYFHNKAASTLASRNSRAFGIILPTLQDSIYLHFVEGARSVFEREGAEFLLQTIDYARGREPAALTALLSQRVRAILLPSLGHTSETLRLLETIPVPIIEFGNLPRRPVQYAVGHSDRAAGTAAARRLIETGRRRIGILCGVLDVTTNARDRLSGFRRAMQEAGLVVDEDRVVQVDHSVEAGLEGLETLLARRPRIDGLVVAGEVWSAAALLQILKTGIRVPEEIAVVGVGEVELGPYLPVPLTTVALPRFDTGVRAAELALALARGDTKPGPVLKLPVNLVVRASA